MHFFVKIIEFVQEFEFLKIEKTVWLNAVNNFFN